MSRENTETHTFSERSSCGDEGRWWGGLSNSGTHKHTYVIPPAQKECSSGQLLSSWCAEIWSSSGWGRHAGMRSDGWWTKSSLFDCVFRVLSRLLRLRKKTLITDTAAGEMWFILRRLREANSRRLKEQSGHDPFYSCKALLQLITLTNLVPNHSIVSVTTPAYLFCYGWNP